MKGALDPKFITKLEVGPGGAKNFFFYSKTPANLEIFLIGRHAVKTTYSWSGKCWVALCLCLCSPTRLCRDALFENGFMPAGFEEKIQMLIRKHVAGKDDSQRIKQIKYVVFFIVKGFFFFVFLKQKPDCDWLACIGHVTFYTCTWHT